MRWPSRRNLIFGCLFIGVFAGLVTCGKALNTFLNDPIPSGTRVRQGSFQSGDVTGTAAIYELPSGINVIRLENVSFTSYSSSMLLLAIGDSGEVNLGSVRAATGNQNYTTNLTGAQNWSVVRISYASTAIPTNEVGRALMIDL